MAADVASQFWRLAESDLASAERLSDAEPLLEQALFHCQQAGEKALKCLVAHRGAAPPPSHDLLLLVSLAGLADEAELSADALLLTQYAVAPRYPFPTRPYNIAELAPALAATRRVLERVRQMRGPE
ncbi:MAG: HEPN domain-containing protein [Longimicrobiales bacterium]